MAAFSHGAADVTLTPPVSESSADRAYLRTMSVLVLIALSLLAAPATADEDADRAYRALERGEVRPLADILTTLERRLQGEVVGVEFESEDGRHVYEFEVVTPGGRLLEIYVDAATGRILEREDDD
jgi:uncharacterized membrane protein YkoI